MRFFALWAGSVLALAAAGCAAPLRFDASVDPLALLDPGSVAYVRLDGSVARELLPAALPPDAAKSLSAVLARTRLVAIGVGGPALQVCLIGDYPFRAASLSLGADPGWKREKTGYFNARLGLRVAVPGPNLVLASTGRLESLIAAAKAPGPSPLPSRLSGLASRELVIWVPDPFSKLAAAIFGEPMEVPALGMLIAARPVGPQSDYDTTIVFLMKDPDSARIYRPALRLAWYGIARGLLGAEADAALGASFTLDGDSYRASGISLSGGALARVLAALRAGLVRSGGDEGI